MRRSLRSAALVAAMLLAGGTATASPILGYRAVPVETLPATAPGVDPPFLVLSAAFNSRGDILLNRYIPATDDQRFDLYRLDRATRTTSFVGSLTATNLPAGREIYVERAVINNQGVVAGVDQIGGQAVFFTPSAPGSTTGTVEFRNLPTRTAARPDEAVANVTMAGLDDQGRAVLTVTGESGRTEVLSPVWAGAEFGGGWFVADAARSFEAGGIRESTLAPRRFDLLVNRSDGDPVVSRGDLTQEALPGLGGRAVGFNDQGLVVYEGMGGGALFDPAGVNTFADLRPLLIGPPVAGISPLGINNEAEILAAITYLDRTELGVLMPIFAGGGGGGPPGGGGGSPPGGGGMPPIGGVGGGIGTIDEPFLPVVPEPEPGLPIAWVWDLEPDIWIIPAPVTVPGDRPPGWAFDPEVAIAYDYAIDGEAAFGWVMVPGSLADLALADGKFTLAFSFDGREFLEELVAGMPYDFPFDAERNLWVRSFRIGGIDPEAGVDPRDPLAFVTVVSFLDTTGEQAGFRFVMEPVVAHLPAPGAEPVPEPGTLALIAVGLLALVAARGRAATTA